MNKKLSILLTAILVFTLTFSSFAGMYSDVSDEHWAYEDIKELTTKDIIEGFPDGSFRGDEAFTRYQMAVKTTRLLDVIEENLDGEIDDVEVAIEAIEEEIEELKGSLTQEQVEEVQSIAEALIGEIDAASSEGLTETKTELEEINADLKEQIDEVYNELFAQYEDLEEEIIEDLKSLQEDLEADIEVNIDDVSEKIAENVEALEELEKMISELQQASDEQSDEISELDETVSANIEELSAISEDVEELEVIIEDETTSLEGLINDVESDLGSRLADLETITWNMVWDYNVNLDSVNIEGPGNAYRDPYYDAGTDHHQLYHPSELFEQLFNIDLLVETDNFNADFWLGLQQEDFFANDRTDFNLENIVARVSGEDFSAEITHHIHRPDVRIREYLYGSESVVSGVEANIRDNQFILSGDAGDVIIAGETAQELFGLDLNLAYGAENIVTDGRNILVAVDTELDLLGFDISPELAVSDKGFEERLFRLNAEGELGPVFVDFNTTQDSGLDPIESPEYYVVDGYDIGAEMDMFNLKVMYDNYDLYDNDEALPLLRISAEEEFLTINNEFNYGIFRNQESSRMQYKANTSRTIGDDLELEAILNWINVDNDFVSLENRYIDDDYVDYTRQYHDDDEVTDDVLDKIFKAGYSLGNLGLNAEFIHNIDGYLGQKYVLDYSLLDGDLVTDATFEKEAADNAGFSQEYNLNYSVTENLSAGVNFNKGANANQYNHTYEADYTRGLIEAGMAKYINHKDNATDLTTGFNLDKNQTYEFIGVDFAPYAEFGYRLASEDLTNYAFGFTADKTVTDRISASGSYEIADKNFEVDTRGSKTERTLDFEYNIANNVGANLSYEDLIFEGVEDVNEDDSYEVKIISGNINVTF